MTAHRISVALFFITGCVSAGQVSDADPGELGHDASAHESSSSCNESTETSTRDDGDDGDNSTIGGAESSTSGSGSSDSGDPPPPSGEMSFFVTSVGNGSSGGNYAGLAGANDRCQALAEEAGAGDRTWHAYLSTAPIEGFGGALVHARDNIGNGPWYNFDGDLVAADVTSLHAQGIAPQLMLAETGESVPTDEHDILTGSDLEGFAILEFPGNPSAPPPTCFNWTDGTANAWTWVGHADAQGPDAWNDAHATSCDEAGLQSTAGSGRLYCFAI